MSRENFVQRTLSAFIGGGIILACISWNKYSFFVLFLVLLCALQREFYGLLNRYGYRPLSWAGIALGVCIFSLSYGVSSGLWGVWVWEVFLWPILLLVFVRRLYRGTIDKSFLDLGLTFLGVLYIALPLSLAHVLVFSGGVYTYEVLLVLVVMVWVYDMGAYGIGSLWGKRKLFSRVSPKKTWEGVWGGALGTLLTAVGVSFVYEMYAMWQWLAIGACVIVAGTYGDLIESMLKRSLGLGNSGHMIPGHGGFLDRFDSFLFALPFVVSLVFFFS